MRGLVALVAVSGCGRVAFDPRSDAGARDATVDASLVCPAGYTREVTGCYRTSVDNLDWFAAEAACEADAVGAHLVVIDNAAEAMVVDRYRPAPTDNAWIGFSDLAVEGAYRTVTNKEFVYTSWGVMEPDGATHDCGTSLMDLGVGDYLCANVDEYICEYDGIPASSAGWGVCPAGYTFTQGGCYRFVDGLSGGGDWFGAEADCEDDGAGTHLVVLDDAVEAAVVDSFVPSAIADHFIGTTDIVTEGVYLSVLGEPLAYTMFEAGEPNGDTLQNCLIFDDASLLNDKECSVVEDYVCEYDGRTPVPASWGQ